MAISLEYVQDKVYKLGARINAPLYLLLVRDQPASDGTPYIEIGNQTLFYVSSERGFELSRKATSSLDELLYIILDRVVSRLAMEYELINRVKGQDSRRIYFSKRIELMSKIEPKWGYKLIRHIDELLMAAPYVDIK